MKGAFQIARIFDIPVKIHWSFGLIFLWVLYLISSTPGGFSWALAAWWSLAIVTLFTCVVLHEFGHALTARRYGIATRDIILLPIGGLAMLTKLPEKPFQEFLVAIAGPLVNVAISLLCVPYFFVVSAEKREELLHFFWGAVNPRSNLFAPHLTELDLFIMGLMVLNVIVALFNLLPAFPMDGGRIFRALLSMRMSRVKATRIASYVGQFFAVLLLAYSIYQFNLIAIFVAIFVFMTAANEFKAVKQDDLLRRTPIGEVLQTNFRRLFENDTLQQAWWEVNQNADQHFLVFDEWQEVKGAISKKKLAAQLEHQHATTPIKYLMSTQFTPLLATDSLKTALQQMQQKQQRIFPVYQKGQLVGVVDEFMLIRFLGGQ
ncbi:MAG: site-2 protease family protein [Bacteroidota bacterium]